jgi:Carboxypeptidase regulatory-like domain
VISSAVRRVTLTLTVALLALLLGAGSASAAGTGTVKGKVTALNGGVPIKGVEVCAYELGEGELEEEACRASKADGTYSIPNLAAGKYIVEFWSGSAGLNYLTQYYDQREFFEEADEVTVSSGGTVENVDAQLEEGGEIKGTVTAAGDGPVEEVLVCAESEEGFGGCAVTDEDGNYTILRLPTDEYAVEFWPAFGGWNYQTQFYDLKAGFEEANPVAVAKGEVKSGIDAVLEPGAVVEGTVFSAATGDRLPFIRVCMLEAATGELAGCTEADSTGHYEFIGRSAGAYKVAFSAELKELAPELFELFPEFFEPEDDGYLPQYYNEKTTLAAADVLNLVPPAVRSGIDAHLLKPSPPAAPLAAARPAPKKVTHRPKPKPHCRKGFKKKRVKGKLRCVKVHGKRHRHAPHRGRIPERLLFRLR